MVIRKSLETKYRLIVVGGWDKGEIWSNGYGVFSCSDESVLGFESSDGVQL